MNPELLVKEKVFLNRSLFEEAERHYSLRKHGGESPLLTELNKVRDHIKCTLGEESTVEVRVLLDRLRVVEDENKSLKTLVEKLESRLNKLESGGAGKPAAPASAAKPAPAAKPASAPAATSAKKDGGDDDDIDLFGDDDEDPEEQQKIREERLKAYADKKAKKPQVVAKSSVLLDVKPWDDETDMAELEKSVRSVNVDGLVWGSSKLVPVAFGVKKLQIQCVIEDDKVSTEVLEEKICEFEDYVQSVDIASFNKI